MSHSFGEGYSTRSDEEGFGGIYGGNQSIGNPSEISHPGAHVFIASKFKNKYR